MGMILAVLVVLSLAACSSSPTAPTRPDAGSGASSWTLGGTTAPGATVQYAGHQTQADAAGRFSFSHQVGAPQAVTVTAAGILDRQVWVAGGRSRTDLEIDTIGLSAPFNLAFYRQFVRNDRDDPGNLGPLRRWAAAPKFYIQTVDDVGEAVGGTTIQTTIEGIVAGVTQFTPFAAPLIETGAEPRGPHRGWVRVLYKHRTYDTDRCGQAYVGADPGEITLWLDICRCSGDPGRVSTHLVLHEVGHAMGFWHVDGRHVMQPISGSGCGPGDRTSSQAERYHAAIVYRRPPGNRDPDLDPASFLSSRAELGGPPPVVQCGMR